MRAISEREAKTVKLSSYLLQAGQYEGSGGGISMTKEKRIMGGMPSDVKKFYLEFKRNNPGREDEYYKAFVKMKQQENRKRLKEEEYEKKLTNQLAKSIQNAAFLPKSN